MDLSASGGVRGRRDEVPLMADGSDFDIVTVYHRRANRLLAQQLEEDVKKFEPEVNFFAVDNTEINRGFGKGCNLGATWGEAPYIGFLNPDCKVEAPFTDAIRSVFEQDYRAVIVGERYNKHRRELKGWGLNQWVCGATMFVRREWFEFVGGFDERFVLYFEETDLCRRAESEGLLVKPIKLPIFHESPRNDHPADVQFKRKHMKRSGRLYREKWSRRG